MRSWEGVCGRRRHRSPRVRGRPHQPRGQPTQHGFIPAGAGQTVRPRRTATAAAAHPRGCGADLASVSVCTVVVGSSPRVRGRPAGGLLGALFHGLIPAGAGQTTMRWWRRRRSGAHPRGCGADDADNRVTALGKGSSPRVRGRPSDSAGVVAGVGLIPAGAGQTGCTGFRIYFVPGSSPRVRGRRAGGVPTVGATGLIPAGAGQTGPFLNRRRLARAHPRGCGADV